jgi:hypothetical protein
MFITKTTKFVWFDFKNGYFFTRVYDIWNDDTLLMRTTSKELWNTHIS